MSAPFEPVRWGIIGPGGIAKAFLLGLNDSDTGKLVAIGTRNPGKASLATDFPGATSLRLAPWPWEASPSPSCCKPKPARA